MWGCPHKQYDNKRSQMTRTSSTGFIDYRTDYSAYYYSACSVATTIIIIGNTFKFAQLLNFGSKLIKVNKHYIYK